MTKERLYLVTKSAYGINTLGYNPKTKEYVYLKNGKEVWREKGDEGLFDYFNEIHATHSFINENVVNQYSIWKKYRESCK